MPIGDLSAASATRTHRRLTLIPAHGRGLADVLVILPLCSGPP